MVEEGWKESIGREKIKEQGEGGLMRERRKVYIGMRDERTGRARVELNREGERKGKEKELRERRVYKKGRDWEKESEG